MERTERYDPEDLEHLMLERGFDELLAEERAYALRHLEGRAEYERMRALLHHVREDKREHEDAGPAVRERVLQAFRDQRQPQWRIWLNSVGGFLLPPRPSMYWRPALALGTVAVLVLAGLMSWNSMEHEDNKVLAEVKQEKPGAPRPAKGTEQDRFKEPEKITEEVQTLTGGGASASGSQDAAKTSRSEGSSMARSENKKEAEDSPREAEQVVAEPARPALMDAPAPDIDVVHAATGSAKISTEGAAVTANEAASTSTSKAKAKKCEEAAGNTDDLTRYAGLAADERAKDPAPDYAEDDLLGLLQAAW